MDGADKPRNRLTGPALGAAMLAALGGDAMAQLQGNYPLAPGIELMQRDDLLTRALSKEEADDIAKHMYELFGMLGTSMADTKGAETIAEDLRDPDRAFKAYETLRAGTMPQLLRMRDEVRELLRRNRGQEARVRYGMAVDAMKLLAKIPLPPPLPAEYQTRFKEIRDLIEQPI